MSMIVEGFLGKASQVAIDVGAEELMKEMGFQQLFYGIYKIVYPHIRRGVRDLQRLGNKSPGILSRQSDESMISYIRRRRLWWRELKELDPKVEANPEILAELGWKQTGSTTASS